MELGTKKNLRILDRNDHDTPRSSSKQKTGKQIPLQAKLLVFNKMSKVNPSECAFLKVLNFLWGGEVLAELVATKTLETFTLRSRTGLSK